MLLYESLLFSQPRFRVSSVLSHSLQHSGIFILVGRNLFRYYVSTSSLLI
jgi:hypothetical protein